MSTDCSGGTWSKCTLYLPGFQLEGDRHMAGGKFGRIVRQEFYEIFTGDFWTFGERIYPPRKVSKVDKHHLTAILIQKD